MEASEEPVMTVAEQALRRTAHTEKVTRAIRALIRRCDQLVKVAESSSPLETVQTNRAASVKFVQTSARDLVWPDVCAPFATESDALLTGLQDYENLTEFAILVARTEYRALFDVPFRDEVRNVCSDILKTYDVVHAALQILQAVDPLV